MGETAPQITSLTIVYSGADQRKYLSSASLAFLLGFHRWPVNSPHKWSVTREMFPFDDVIMKIAEFWFGEFTNALRNHNITRANIRTNTLYGHSSMNLRSSHDHGVSMLASTNIINSPKLFEKWVFHQIYFKSQILKNHSPSKPWGWTGIYNRPGTQGSPHSKSQIMGWTITYTEISSTSLTNARRYYVRSTCKLHTQ